MEKEMRNILSEELKKFRNYTYQKLADLVKKENVEAYEVADPEGNRYQIEIQFLWDSNPNGNIRVIGSIDGIDLKPSLTGFSLLRLMRRIGIKPDATDDFIMNPTGEFVGE
jgi:hypothetical protein